MSTDIKTYRPVSITCTGGQTANLLVRRIKIKLPEVLPSAGWGVQWYTKQKGQVTLQGILAKTDGTAPDPVEFLKAPLELPEDTYDINLEYSDNTGSVELKKCECTFASITGRLSASGSLYVCHGSLGYLFEPDDLGGAGDNWVWESITAESNRQSEEMAIHRPDDGIVPGIMEFTEWEWKAERSRQIKANTKSGFTGESGRPSETSPSARIIHSNGQAIRTVSMPRPPAEDSAGRSWDNKWYKTDNTFQHNYGELLATEKETWNADCPPYAFSVKVLEREEDKY